MKPTKQKFCNADIRNLFGRFSHAWERSQGERYPIRTGYPCFILAALAFVASGFLIGCGGGSHAAATTPPTPPTLPSPSSLSSSCTTAATVGAYNCQIAVSGGQAPFTWTANHLPVGLRLTVSADTTTATISGTVQGQQAMTTTSASLTALFATASAPTTTASVQLTVTSSTGQSASLTYTITLTISPLGITTTSPLPGATLGSAYTATVTANGGLQPYTWSVATGSSLPAGLMLTSGSPGATISGTPTVTGTFQFTLDVSDAETTPMSVSANFTLTVSTSSCTPGQTTLCGQFTFLVQGALGAGETPIMIAGTFVADGNGNITDGVLDFNSDTLRAFDVAITSGLYTIGNDGRGTVTLVTSTTIGSNGGNGTIKLTFALNAVGTFAFVFESDDTSATGTGNHGSGYMQLADATKFNAASITGGYALGLLGGTANPSRPRAAAIAAVTAGGGGCGLNSNGSSVFIIHDQGVVNNNSATPTTFICSGSGLATIDSEGRGTVTFVLGTAGTFSTVSLNFSFYVIDGTKVIFISTDIPLTGAAGANLAILSGTMFQQAKANFSTSDLACGFTGDTNKGCIYGISGESGKGSHVGMGRAVGTAVSASTVTFNLTIDENKAGTVGNRTEIGWTGTVSANGVGIVTPPAGAQSSPAGFVLIDTDNAIVGSVDGSVQVGVIRPQTAVSPSAGPGRFIFGTQVIANGSVPNASGFVAVAAPATNATIAGTIDVEQVFSPPTEIQGAPFNGNYTMDAPATGRGTGTSAAPGPSAFVLYNLGPTEIILLETDTTNLQPVLIDLIQ